MTAWDRTRQWWQAWVTWTPDTTAEAPPLQVLVQQGAQEVVTLLAAYEREVRETAVEFRRAVSKLRATMEDLRDEARTHAGDLKTAVENTAAALQDSYARDLDQRLRLIVPKAATVPAPRTQSGDPRTIARCGCGHVSDGYAQDRTGKTLCLPCYQEQMG